MNWNPLTWFRKPKSADDDIEITPSLAMAFTPADIDFLRSTGRGEFANRIMDARVKFSAGGQP